MVNLIIRFLLISVMGAGWFYAEGEPFSASDQQAAPSDDNVIVRHSSQDASFLALKEHLDFAFGRIEQVETSLYKLVGFYKATFVNDATGQDFFDLAFIDDNKKNSILAMLEVPCSTVAQSDRLFESLIRTFQRVDQSYALGLDMSILPRKNYLVYLGIVKKNHFMLFINHIMAIKTLSDDERLVDIYHYIVAFLLLNKLYESESTKPYIHSISPVKVNVERFHAALKPLSKSQLEKEGRLASVFNEEVVGGALSGLAVGGVSLATEKLSSVMTGQPFNWKQALGTAAAPVVVMTVFTLLKNLVMGKKKSQ